MDFDDEEERRHGANSADPLPPDDWDGFQRSARLEALYTAQRPYLAGYFRRNAHPQDVGDLVQECFRKLVSAKGAFAANLDKPGAYLARTAHNNLEGIEAMKHSRKFSRKLCPNGSKSDVSCPNNSLLDGSLSPLEPPR